MINFAHTFSLNEALFAFAKMQTKTFQSKPTLFAVEVEYLEFEVEYFEFEVEHMKIKVEYIKIKVEFIKIEVENI